MSLDRAATLRQAEKLLRQGKLEQAIAEYVHLVDDQPRDWNTANLLGDLYIRAGQLDRAIEQYTRIADSLRREGFLPKAAALYKKILKLRPDSDHALMQAGELAAEQGLLADARSLLTAASAARRAHGDRKGALAAVVRLGSLDRHDVAARMAGAQARHELDDVPGALTEFIELAMMLVEEGRDHEALAPLREASALDPANMRVNRELARIFVAEGRIADAAAHLTPDAVIGDSALTLLAVRVRLEQGDEDTGFALFDELLARDRHAAADIASLAATMASTNADLAFRLMDRLVTVELDDLQTDEAVRHLRAFIDIAPTCVPALTRLVDLCVDGAWPEGLSEAQGRLADAYLSGGRASEAKYIAEDLLTREPWQRRHYHRLLAALAAEGQVNPERVLADWLAETPAFGLDEPSEFDVAPEPPASPATPEPDDDEFDRGVDAPDDDASFDAGQVTERDETRGEPAPAPASAAAPTRDEARTRANPHAIDLSLVFGRPAPPRPPAPPAVVAPGNVEEDLSLVLDELHQPPASLASAGGPAVAPSASPDPAPPPSSPSRPAVAQGPRDLERVFADFREEASRRPSEETADAALTRGSAMVDAGELDEAAVHLRTAARSPRRRFAAARLLADVHERLGRVDAAIEWLGHAVDAPGVTPAERSDTLLRLADLLERSGETARALAVCLELQADAGDYKDLAARIERLSRA